MRRVSATLALIALSATAPRAEMSKTQCADMVAGTRAIADQLKRMEVAFAKLEMKKNAELTSGAIFDNAQGVEKARQDVLAMLAAYREKADALSAQLHDCADTAPETAKNATPAVKQAPFAPLFPK